MDEQKIRTFLESVVSGDTPIDAAIERLRSLPFEDLGFAKIDHHRGLRKGFPETIFAAGKTPEQVIAIMRRMRDHGSNVLATRCGAETVRAVLEAIPETVHHEEARALTLTVSPPERLTGYICVVCAGTSDIPIAEEAFVTCESMGCDARRVYDVGVAGIHRVLEQRPILVGANAIIVCAGMEGALASVVAGLVDKPVIAAPTSVGYGASFGGVAALLGMLNTCSPGVAVVNIDNGYGAGAYASIINRIANGL
jgi:NCAIR mutase (PurE)-related protein